MSRWGRLLDAESVRPYQTTVYSAYIIAGLQNLAMGVPPGAVTQAMGHAIALIWSALLIIFPVATMLGLWISKRGWPSGLWMQTAGDLGVVWASAAYAVAIFQATWAQRASFAAWIAIAVGVCALGMVIRDVRRIRQAGRLVKRMEHTGDD